MRILTFGLVVALLGGCAKSMDDIGAPLAVTPTSPTVAGLDVYAADRTTNSALPAYRGESVVQARTYMDPPGSGDREEKRGRCSVTGGTQFTAEIDTPRKIIVPNDGARSLPLAAQCDVDGRTGSGVSHVFNRTKRDIQNAGSNNGLIGLFVAAVIAEAVSDENDEFEYAPLTIDVEE